MWIENMEKELTDNPTVIQGFNVKQVDKEKYLGMMVNKGGVQDTIKANIAFKRGRVEPTIQKIRQFIRNSQVLRLGRVKTAALMIQAKILPALLYDTESWINPTKENYEEMENILKSAIIRILSLPPSTNYESMLWEMGNYHVEQWMDLGKLRFFSKKMNLKEEGRMYEAIREELLDEKFDNGLVKEMERLSEKYNLPNVLLHYVRPRDIAEAVREHSKDKICHEVLLTKTIPIIVSTRKFTHEHHTFSTMEERAITCFNTGNLVFKDTCPNMFREKHIFDRFCMFLGCDGRDSYAHVRFECKFYTTRYRDTGYPVKDNAKFLVALDQERQKRWKTPLIVVSGYL